MSYYQGDYYRGDPFLGGLIGVGAKLVRAGIPKIGAIAKGLFRRKGARVITGAGGVIATTAIGTALGTRMAGRAGERVGGRRMNVANPKALRRAIRRARGFAKLARKVLTFPITKPPRGRALFKKRGR